MRVLFLLFMIFFIRLNGQNSSKENLYLDSICIQRIDLDGSNLKILPDSIFKYKRIKDISIGYNPKINWKKVSKQLQRFEKIECLIIQSQSLKRFPKELTILNNISELDLRQNSIKSFPIEIKKMDSIKIIDISINNIGLLKYNKIEKLFYDLSGFKNLEVLLLTNNYLDTLPVAITKLNKLKTLFISNNIFTRLPKELLLFKKLSYIGIDCIPSLLTTNDLSEFNNFSFHLNSDNTKFNIPFKLEDYKKLNNKYPKNFFW